MPAPTRATHKRSYDSSRRARQAAQTRADVMAAASQLFSEQGWAGTTLAAIADAAGVSVETIYNGFGAKKGLLRTALETAVVGDAEPVPLVERPEFAALGDGPVDERIRRGMALVAEIHERSAGLWQAIIEAASADEEVDRWRLELEAGRRLDVRRSIEVVFGRSVDDALVTMLWVLYSPEAYTKLVHDEGLSRPQYEALLVDATTRLALLDRPS